MSTIVRIRGAGVADRDRRPRHTRRRRLRAHRRKLDDQEQVRRAANGRRLREVHTDLQR